ncbi:MAG: DUF983 domain-containing protein [Acidimicrobiales bacterium]|nr:DUF983 domain-containing protein [Actinomycetota bacterium]
MTVSQPARASRGRMLARGLVRRCAVCGGGGLFLTWFRMRDRCPRCSYKFEREEGFFLGAYVLNLAVTEGLLILFAIIPSIVIFAGDSDVSIVPLLISGLIAAVGGPLAFYPFSKTLWVAIELSFRSVDAGEPTDDV